MSARLPCGCDLVYDVIESAHSDYEIVCKHGTRWGFKEVNSSVPINPISGKVRFVNPDRNYAEETSDE